MRRGLRAGFIFVLVLTLVVAFSASFAEDDCDRLFSGARSSRHGLSLQRRNGILCAPPNVNARDERKPVEGFSVLGAIDLSRSREVMSFTYSGQVLAQRAASKLRFVYIYINHPHHAPPFEI